MGSDDAVVSKSKWVEADMYEPVRDFLQAQGFTVRGEVRHCDVVGVRDEDVVIIEMKRAINASLFVQAVERQRLCDTVYVAVLRPKESIRSPRWRGLQQVLRRLELGLLLVDPTPSALRPVNVVCHPTPYTRKQNTKERRALLTEVERRTGDYNRGGSTRIQLMTAYRESAIRIACWLEWQGAMSPRALKAHGTGDKTPLILRDNHYGWFVREARGVYNITEKGLLELHAHAPLAEPYRRQIRAAADDDTRDEIPGAILGGSER